MIYLEFEDGEQISLGAVESLTPKYAIEKTTHEVEDGSEVTDNTNVLPDQVSISGFVSNVPLSTTGGAFDPQAEGDHTYFHDRVAIAEKQGELVTLVAGVFGVWESMQITEFQPAFEVETGSGLNYTLELEEFRVVDAKVEVNRPNPGKDPRLNVDKDRLAEQRRIASGTRATTGAQSAGLDAMAAGVN